MKVQRWNPVSIAGAYGLYADVMLTDDGNYVLYADYTQREADHAAEVEGLRAAAAGEAECAAEMRRTLDALESALVAAERERDALRADAERMRAELAQAPVGCVTTIYSLNGAPEIVIAFPFGLNQQWNDGQRIRLMPAALSAAAPERKE
jgi:hypothetical protein